METLSKCNSSPLPVSVLRGHISSVNSVCFDTENWLFSASSNGSIKKWDMKTRRTTTSWKAHGSNGVLSLSMLEDNKLLSHGRDGLLKVWDVNRIGLNESDCVQSYDSQSYSFTKAVTRRWNEAFTQPATISNTNLVLSPTNEPSEAMLLDLKNNQKVLQIPSFDKASTGMCMSLLLLETCQGPISAISYEGGHLGFYDIKSSKWLMSAQIYKNPLLSFDIGKKSNYGICTSSGKDVVFMNFDFIKLSMKAKTVYSSNKEGYGIVKIRNDEKLFATGGWDHRIRVFSVKSKKPLAILKHHSDSIYGLDFCQNSSLMASGSKDTKIALWSIY